jgi:teichoic acid transport system ATP-binding protein
MKEFKQNGVTMILLSHSMENVRQFCDKVLYISYGSQQFFGPPDDAIAQYKNAIVT